MGQVMFIVWRESVEALLVVGILYAWLRNGGESARKGVPYLWAGVALGIAAAIGLGAALLGFTEILSGDAQDYFQIAMVLVAAVLIVQMVLWMKKHGRTLKRDMEASLQKSSESSNWWGVLVLVALAIAREGSETVIFLYGLGFGQGGAISGAMVAAVLIGLGLALLTFYLLQLGGRIFSWRLFFRVTEVMLLFLAAGLLMTGIDRLISLGLVPTLGDQVWNSAALLDDASPAGNLIATLTGYRAHPAVMNLLVYAAYWAVVWLFLRRAQPQARPVRAA
ncbi:FTR1 family iron permease [Pandoraea thiooxydans]|uniref:FTR1 family iron permease n=1 Tax=Pandoraea thiooxydans TaxID=445709 RepID=A0A0G3ENN3_9BURK|nr:FTR1 family protein [Pandoraea thiooxydans]AKJ66897.1 FTR1 family iron permease [Pandoraea thiooxydans]APR93780.1 FTR1 family iron permease [Pandoraea thiooxydans]